LLELRRIIGLQILIDDLRRAQNLRASNPILTLLNCVAVDEIDRTPSDCGEFFVHPDQVKK
jgi:hypothetical protein